MTPVFSLDDLAADMDQGYWISSEHDWEDCMNQIMLSTGLRDKNGKEIFEADIVRVIASLPLRVVQWRNAAFHIESPNWQKDSDMPTHPLGWQEWNGSLKVEIVGNVYENKKLLE